MSEARKLIAEWMSPNAPNELVKFTNRCIAVIATFAEARASLAQLTPVPLEPSPWKLAYEGEAAKFQQETRRTSELSALLQRWIERHEAEHEPGPWSRSCAVCALVGESRALLVRPINEARAALAQPAGGPVEPSEKQWEQMIDDRDRCYEWADKLADAIAGYFGVDIGEHTAGAEANDPWANALDTIERERAALAAVPQVQAILPNPGSPEASAMIDSLLAEYQYPANTKNAARAGYEAARRMLAASPVAPQEVKEGEPTHVRWERRRGYGDGCGNVNFGAFAWEPCTEGDAQRVTGLRSWQVRKVECFERAHPESAGTKEMQSQ